MQKLLLIFLVVLLQACTSGGESGSSEVEIGFYGEAQYLFPASWRFGVLTDLDVTDLQWRFSDDNSVVFGSEAEHVFSVPGVHSITLQYSTADGDVASVRRDIEIRSGTISGLINGTANHLVDADTRDVHDSPDANNDFASAQPLTENAILSGVVDAEDDVDIFQVKLNQGQLIQLSVADQSQAGEYAQIRAEIYSSQDLQSPLAAAENLTDLNTGQWSFPVPETGPYFVKLSAVDATVVTPSNGRDQYSHGIYSLRFEQGISNAEFSDTDILVLFKEKAGYQAQGLRVKHSMGRLKTITIHDAELFMAEQGLSVARRLMKDRRWQTLQVINFLNQHSDIEVAEPNWRRYPLAVPPINDPYFENQRWHYDDINLQQAWQELDANGKEALGSDAVTVAVLDTGIVLDHPDLAANIINGYDFVDNDVDATDPGDKGNQALRSSFHGTHVAGTVAAISNNIGVAGVAPGVKVMPVRVLDTDGGFVSDIIEGICYAAQLDDAYCNNIPVAPMADIINLSLGNSGRSSIEEHVINLAMDKGLIVIAAAGNASSSDPVYPAGYDRVISVSATNSSLGLAAYSNFGSTIDITAPGGDSSGSGVFSTVADDAGVSVIPAYGSLSGTSMASPHVAGVAALLKTAYPLLNHDVFRTMLVTGDLTRDIGEFGRDDAFGYGIVDAYKAVETVISDNGPRIISSLFHLRYGVGNIQKSFVLSDGGQNVGNVSVSEDIEWLILDRSEGLGTYNATISTLGFEEGVYSGEIRVSSDDPDVSDALIKVTAQVGNPQLSSNPGVQYLNVIDDTGISATRSSISLFAKNGQYRFEVGGLAKGRYLIGSGSDLDGDGRVCDAGESCSAYPTIEEPQFLEIREDLAAHEIVMESGYDVTGQQEAIQRSGLNAIFSQLIASDQFQTGQKLREW